MDSFIDANFDSPLDLIKPWRSGLELVKLGGFGKLGKKVASFFDDERLQRIFSFQSMYAGLAPYEALALYAVITYMDSVEGVFVPEGGMHMMAAGLAEAVTEAGVDIRYASPVTRILRTPGGAVTGVEIDASERLDADAVVCNVDLPVAYRELLPGIDAPRAARKGKYSPSCLLWVAGVRGPAAGGREPPQHPLRRGLGRLVQGADRRRRPHARPVDPRHAAQPRRPLARTRGPLEHLRPRAHAEPQRHDRLEPRARHDRRRTCAGASASLGYPTEVVVEEIYDPLDWERMGMEQGTPFALAHTFFQTGPFRPNNVDRKVPGLVFTGSSTLPGVGVPMVLVSGKLAAERVEQYARERRR